MRTELIWNREKMRQEGVWLQPGDVEVRSNRKEDLFSRSIIGGETRYYFTKIMTSFHLTDEVYNIEDDPDYILRHMELEALQALQTKLEEIVIGKMLHTAAGEDGLLPTSLYIPQRGEHKFYLRCRMKFFPSRHVKPEEVLAIVNPESYHNLYRMVSGGENPEAIVGKIKWLTPWFE